MGATIKDIAEKTGLGLATISKYLNGGHVLDKNRLAIEKAIADLDFQVNSFARSLKTHQSNTVGVVIPQLNNLFMTSIVTGIEEILRNRGYGVLVCDTGRQEERETEVLAFLQNKMVDGVILMTSTSDASGLNPLLKRGIPVVLMDRKVERLEGKLDMVLLDNYRAAYESTLRLIDRGHTKIGLLLGSDRIYTSRERQRGYEAALKERGLGADASLIRFTGFTTEGGCQQTRKLLADHPEMTALFATNFEMTLGALLALKDAGIRVPEQMAMVGFDNRELAQAIEPGLVIVAQPLREISEQVSRMLLARMQPDGKQKPAEIVILQADIEGV